MTTSMLWGQELRGRRLGFQDQIHKPRKLGKFRKIWENQELSTWDTEDGEWKGRKKAQTFQEVGMEGDPG